MKERIIHIMEKEGLTSSKFAESIGIQRAAMSHIISGRNNPSLDVVTKILYRYPTISPEWLLMGKGEMFKARNSQTELNLFGNTLKFEEQDKPLPEYRKEITSNELINTPKESINERIILPEKTYKKITQIMVIYSDNSLETFVPEKSRKE